MEGTIVKQNDLQKIIKEEQIAPTQAEILMATFQPILSRMKDYELKTREINVTDISQIEEMKKAGALRKEIKELRCKANNTREELKSDYLRGGRAIQAVYNLIEALATPLEKKLEESEKFKEIMEEKQKRERLFERQNLLQPFVQDVTQYNLYEMSEAGFQEILKNSEVCYNNKIKEEKELEEARLKKEEEERIENERIRIENAKLKQEQEEKDTLIKKQQKEKEDLIKKQQEELAEEKRKRDLEEKERQDKIDEENRIKEENEKRIEEEKRQAELAPDKEKLTSIITDLNNLKFPEVNSEKAKQIILNVKDLIGKVSIYILKNSKEL